jgi:hypothetical protein
VWKYNARWLLITSRSVGGEREAVGVCILGVVGGVWWDSRLVAFDGERTTIRRQRDRVNCILARTVLPPSPGAHFCKSYVNDVTAGCSLWDAMALDLPPAHGLSACDWERVRVSEVDTEELVFYRRY